MTDRAHALPLADQARQLGISRGSIYYLARVVSAANLVIMRIDELHLLYPFVGSRMLRDPLQQEGVEGSRLHVPTLMKRMRTELRPPEYADALRMISWLAAVRGPRAPAPSPCRPTRSDTAALAAVDFGVLHPLM